MLNKQNDEETAGEDKEVEEIRKKDRDVDTRSSYTGRNPRAETPRLALGVVGLFKRRPMVSPNVTKRLSRARGLQTLTAQMGRLCVDGVGRGREKVRELDDWRLELPAELSLETYRGPPNPYGKCVACAGARVQEERPRSILSNSRLPATA